jgi:hypothetical protein
MPTQPEPAQVEWVPWSELGPEWIELWAGADQPEHVEVTGQTGSGKTYWLVAALQERAAKTDDREILVCNKPADGTLSKLGWPITDRWEDVRRYRQVIFWPRTNLTGEEREAYQEQRFYDLLNRLWVPNSNCVIAYDEIGYLETLSKRMKKLIDMYWRESRSQGITQVAMKQRPVWVNRSQHSESRWKVVFPPEDRADMRRFAELLGPVKEWEPVLDQLGEREFIIKYSGRREDLQTKAFVSWIDEPLHPIASQTEDGQHERPANPQYRKGR